MTTPDPGRETRVVDVKGRSIVVRKLTDAQLALVAREVRMGTRADVSGERRMEAVGTIFNVLESQVVQLADRGYLIDLVIEGDLEMDDLTGFVKAFETKDERPVVRRGRPPKRA